MQRELGQISSSAAPASGGLHRAVKARGRRRIPRSLSTVDGSSAWYVPDGSSAQPPQRRIRGSARGPLRRNGTAAGVPEAEAAGIDQLAAIVEDAARHPGDLVPSHDSVRNAPRDVIRVRGTVQLPAGFPDVASGLDRLGHHGAFPELDLFLLGPNVILEREASRKRTDEPTRRLRFATSRANVRRSVAP